MRLTLRIENHPYLHDHRIEEQPVYPAVESLERLAEAVVAHNPGQSVSGSRDAEFLRFLPLPDGTSPLEAITDMETKGHDAVTAALGTMVRTSRGSISRMRDHVRVTFSDIPHRIPLSLDTACAAEGICFPVPAERIYEELVPFGPSFHNAAGVVLLSGHGAVAELHAPHLGTLNPPLGSPFILDAAFHVACAWGQRYHGYVAFPVGYAERTIIRPTAAGESYFCKVIPGETGTDTLDFDIWIYDGAGELREATFGIRMKDIFKHKMIVPAWVKTAGQDNLRTIKQRSEGMSVVELAGILPFAEKILSPRELEAGLRQHPRKRNQHRGARIALKRLARILYRNGVPEDPKLIETISPDGIRPVCMLPGRKQDFYCSASHDDRFAIAVGGHRPVGVDVERLTGTLLKGAHIYMKSSEQALCERSSLGRMEASIRVWTAKECAAKALNMPLAAAWSQVELKEIGEAQSIVSIEGRSVEAVHAAVDDHIFTLLQILE